MRACLFRKAIYFWSKFVQYIERQVVLFDAIEDAAFTSVNDMEGAGSIKALIREATFAGKMQAFKNKLKDLQKKNFSHRKLLLKKYM